MTPEQQDKAAVFCYWAMAVGVSIIAISLMVMK